MNALRAACSLLLATLPFACVVGCSGGEDGVETNPSVSEALTMPACGTTLGTFDGTAAHSNGVDTGTGYSCAGWGTYGLRYQCVELVMRHFKTHWNLSWHGNAKDLLNNAPKADVDVFYNGDSAHPPVAGDMVVWPNGAYGHVALVTSVGPSSITILEQNVKGSGTATLGYANGKIAARWGNWVPQGWAHAKANGATNTNTNTNPNPNTNTINWSCNNSAYNGGQYWTCSNGNLYECQNGVPQEKTCSSGCQVNALGTDDTCKSTTVSWNCANSAYNGQQYWTCSGNARYECQNGVPQMQACPNGCQSMSLGVDDQCK